MSIAWKIAGEQHAPPPESLIDFRDREPPTSASIGNVPDALLGALHDADAGIRALMLEAIVESLADPDPPTGVDRARAASPVASVTPPRDIKIVGDDYLAPSPRCAASIPGSVLATDTGSSLKAIARALAPLGSLAPIEAVHKIEAVHESVRPRHSAPVRRASAFWVAGWNLGRTAAVGVVLACAVLQATDSRPGHLQSSALDQIPTEVSGTASGTQFQAAPMPSEATLSQPHNAAAPTAHQRRRHRGAVRTQVNRGSDSRGNAELHPSIAKIGGR